MNQQSTKIKDPTVLRLSAEQRLEIKSMAYPTTEIDQKRLMHELAVHQVELEMQIETAEDARIIAETALAETRLAQEHAVEYLNRALLAEKQSIETRRLIGQELHDDLGQHLTGLVFMAENLTHDLQVKNQPESTLAVKITQSIREAISKTRYLAQQLYPLSTEDVELGASLQRFLQEVQTTFGIECKFHNAGVKIEDNLSSMNLYRIAQEAVNNAVKHSGASKITVSLSSSESSTIMDIMDNGCGIGEIAASANKPGLGLKIMQQRAKLSGANLEFKPVAAGGTLVHVSLPIVN